MLRKTFPPPEAVARCVNDHAICRIDHEALDMVGDAGDVVIRPSCAVVGGDEDAALVVADVNSALIRLGQPDGVNGEIDVEAVGAGVPMIV